MKAVPSLVLVTLALATASSTLAQYSARTLTRKIVPQPQQPAGPRPGPGYAPAAAPARPPTAAQAAKIKADKSKNEVKQFEYFQRRAREGSDHAQYQLGVRYLTGKGTDPDEKLGREWLAKSAKQGNDKAKKHLSELPALKEEPATKKKSEKVEKPEKAEIAAATKPAPAKPRSK